MNIEKRGDFFKADGRLIYGWALVCEEKNAAGEWTPYVDTQNDHIPEDVMVEAALDFAKNSRIGKDMHAGDQVASVPFIYVITKASNSLGIETNKTGMLIGWEPDDATLLDAVGKGERTGFSIGGFVLESGGDLGKLAKSAGGEGAGEPRVFRRFRIDEISLVDRPAMVGATVGYVKRADGSARRVIAKRAGERTVKHSLYTTEVDGHQHQISIYEDGTLWAQHATAAGAEYGHSHGIVRGDDGTLVILADAGHTHELAEGQTAVVVVPVDAIVVVANSAAKSTHQNAPRNVGSQPEQTMSQDKTIADLTAKLAKAERLATLTDAQRAHYSQLGVDGEGYLAKSFAERQAVLDEIEKANGEVYKSTSTGEVFRAKDDPRLVAMAKRQDKQAEELAKRDEAIEKAEITKLAKETLDGVAGDDETHAYIVKSIRKGGGDVALVDKALATLRSAKAFAKESGKTKGVNPGEGAHEGDPLAAFNAGVAAYAEKNQIKDEGLALEKFLGTTEGRALKKSYDATRAYGKQP